MNAHTAQKLYIQYLLCLFDGCIQHILQPTMPSPPHATSVGDRTVPLDDQISLPPSAYQAQLPSYSRGDKAPQSRNSTIIPDSVSRKNYTATNSPSQQQSVAADSEYRQERIFYALAPTERSQGRPMNPSTGRFELSLPARHIPAIGISRSPQSVSQRLWLSLLLRVGIR